VEDKRSDFLGGHQSRFLNVLWRERLARLGPAPRERLIDRLRAGSINRDRVHLLLSIPASLSVSRAVQHLKGRSSHKLLNEFGLLRKRYWGQHLWARGYWVVSSGNPAFPPCSSPSHGSSLCWPGGARAPPPYEIDDSVFTLPPKDGPRQ
jgi:REP element-mobilizing transposase RayT